MKKIIALFLFLLFVVSGWTSSANANIVIAEQGKSSFTIVIPTKSPKSIRDAAQELQSNITESIRVNIPIRKDSENITGPIISLGATVYAEKASISIEEISDGGFCIETKEGNLYIIGSDTAATIKPARNDGELVTNNDVPGPQYTTEGGASNGTANGVYYFLEKYLDVRWLMPGDIGRDVPSKKKIVIPNINYKESPRIVSRIMNYLVKPGQNIQSIHEWRRRQKLGTSIAYYKGNSLAHSFWKTINEGYGGNYIKDVNTDEVKRAFNEHPEWFAMDDNDNRIRPRDHYDKLETTNPDLIKWFAAQAAKALKNSDRPSVYPIAPSDGSGWSQSSESKKYYDPSPAEMFGSGTDDREAKSDSPSMTPLVLKWYRDVSAEVAKELPQGKLYGLIYGHYLYPPQNDEMKLPDNFIPGLAISPAYGGGLYRSEKREIFNYLIKEWAKIAPSNWLYMDFSTEKHNAYGTLRAPGVDNLNFIFSHLSKYKFTMVRYAGDGFWSNGALLNYIVAKLLWDPDLDASEIQNEWLMRAYGPEAGAIMGKLYEKLELWEKEYYNEHPTTVKLWERYFSKYYAPHYQEIEDLFLEADAQPMTSKQKARLDLIKQNLILLRWRMTNAGYIEEDNNSPLTKNSSQVEKIMLDGNHPRTTEDKAITISPISWSADQPKRTPLEVVKSDLPKDVSVTQVPNAGYVLLYADETGNVSLTPNDVSAGSALVGYRLYAQREKGNGHRLAQQGLLYDGGDITFNAKKDTLYLLRVVAHGVRAAKPEFTLSIKNAVAAQVDYKDKILHIQRQKTPLYVYIPKGLDLKASNKDDGVEIAKFTASERVRELAKENVPEATVHRTITWRWKFQTDPKKQGEKNKVFGINYSDESWKGIRVTDYWHNQGYSDYYGTTWYRNTFTVDRPLRGKIRLFFGAVDGDAIVYLNGQKVGEHLLKDGRGWDEPFVIDVTDAFKNKAKTENTVAIQVTKDSYVGGIYKGVALLEDTKK